MKSDREEYAAHRPLLAHRRGRWPLPLVCALIVLGNVAILSRRGLRLDSGLAALDALEGISNYADLVRSVYL